MQYKSAGLKLGSYHSIQSGTVQNSASLDLKRRLFSLHKAQTIRLRDSFV